MTRTYSQSRPALRAAIALGHLPDVSEEFDRLRIDVTAVEPSRDSVWLAEGVDPDGRVVSFAGDWRAMLDLAEALEADGSAVASVERWQVTAVRSPIGDAP